jgi:peptidoglycan-associated lipoprotein
MTISGPGSQLHPSIAGVSTWLSRNTREYAGSHLLFLVLAALTACSGAPATPVAKEGARSTVTRIEQPGETPSAAKPVEPPPPATNTLAHESPNTGSSERSAEHLAEKSIYFLVGDSTLSPSSLQKLQRHAQYLKQNPKRRATLIGYSESFGSRNYTLAIMEGRLAAVSAQLQEFGVEKSRIRRIISGDKGSQKSCEVSTCRQRVEIRFR